MSNPIVPKGARFSVIVPKPKTRLNLGKADGNAKFGYDGAALQTEGHVWIDGGKITQIQTKTAMRLQAGTTYEQFSNGDMTMASYANGTVATYGKLILNSGGGQGATDIPTSSGASPAWQPFINLSLHYVADGVRTELKKLFYGGKWETHQSRNASQKKWFVEKGAANAPADGFIHEIAELLDDAGFDRSDEKLQGEIAKVVKPMQWTPDCVAAHQFRSWNTSEYTFLNAVDPYAPTDVKGTNSIAKGVNRSLHAYPSQIAIMMKRRADAAELLLPSIAMMDLVWRVRAVIDGARGLASFIELEQWNDLVVKPFQKLGKDGLSAPPSETWPWPEDPGGLAPGPLTSLPAPYQVLAESPTLTVTTSATGTPKKLDLSGFLEPATMTLTLAEGTTRLRATRAGSPANGDRPSLTLDGAKGSVDAVTGSWALPPDFTATAAGVLEKGGATFAFGSPDGLALVDLTFEKGHATLSVDGTSFNVPLASLTASTAEDRASQLAGLLQGKGGVTASASGATVTVTSPNRGAASSVALLAGGFERFGLSGVAVGGAGTMTAAELEAKLAGVPDLKVTRVKSGEVEILTLESTAEKGPLLEVEGDPAVTIFGANPAIAEMKPTEKLAEASKTPGTDFLVAMSNWGALAPVQERFQAYFDANRGLAKMADLLKSTASSLHRLLTGRKGQSPPSVGLSAGLGGIQLATQGKMTAAAHSVTFFATGNNGAAPSWKKAMVPDETMLAAVNWLDEKWEGLVDKLGMWNAPLAPRGELNAIANGELRLVARDAIRLVSRDSIQGVGHAVKLRAVTDAEVTAKETLFLRGKSVVLGHVAEKVATAPVTAKTESVAVSATDSLTMAVHPNGKPKMMVFVDATKGTIGLSAAKGSALSGNRSEDDLKVHLDPKKGEVRLASDKSRVLVHPQVVQVLGDKSVLLAAGGKTALKATSGKLALHGVVDVGGALTVKGAAGPKVDVATELAKVDLTVQQLQVQQATIRAAAKALQAVIATLATAVRPIGNGVPPMFGNPMLGASHRAYKALGEQLKKLDAKDAEIRQKLAAAHAPAALLQPPAQPLADLGIAALWGND